MKVVNLMNFVRQIDERKENSTARMFGFTKAEMRLVNEYGVENTFLLQYDVLCDDNFVELFKTEATEKTELPRFSGRRSALVSHVCRTDRGCGICLFQASLPDASASPVTSF